MMKLSSTTTTVNGSAHHASLRRCAAAIGGRAPEVVITRLISLREGPRNGPPHPPTLGASRPRRAPPRLRPSSVALPGVLLLALGIEITAVAIVEDDRRELVDLQSPDRFRAEILVGDDLELLDVAREHRPGAADRAEVHALELLERVLHDLAAVALAHGAFQPELQQRGRELVHPARRRGPDGARDVAGLGGRGPRVIDDGTTDVDRQL